MPEIRLQDYTAKVKGLIRSVRLDEAIAHAQHILRHYPKHIETYCLLGEACLEEEMYREAIEFFQRALSADPENLIARVGLGIIYDEQGSVPEAIWQLERAFELAPGNAEVRRELHRLYVQQDGAEKARLRLTRGALGRLYSRNGLYERAIGEFHAVLRQDPDLPDIQVALAEALWRDGRRLEAVEVCLEIIEGLPNCLKANLILGEVWLRGENEAEGEERLRVVRPLDPEGLVAQEMMGQMSPLPVEEILIPELEAVPAEPEVVPLAEWRPEEEPEVVAEAEPGEAEEELPEWLRDVGVVEEEAALELEAEEIGLEPQPEEEVPVAEMPEWLREVMEDEEVSPAEEPVALEEVAEVEEVSPPEEIPEWLRDVEEPEVKVPGAAGVLVSAAVIALDEEELEPAETEMPPEELEAPPGEEIPEWLQELVGEEIPPVEEAVEAAPIAEVAEEEVPPVEEMPEWLQEVEAPEEAVPEHEVPASLQALVEAGLLDEADLESAMIEMSADELEAQRAEEVPDWLQELVGEEEAPTVVEELPRAEAELEIEEALAAEVVLPVIEVPVEEVAPIEEIVLPVIEEPVEEVAPIEEIVLPVIEEPVEEVLLVEEVAPPVVEAMVEEAPPVEEVEEEIAVPSRADELLEQLKAQPRDYNARLELARLYREERDWDAALAQYERLISARRFLPEVIEQLEPLVEEGADQALLYQLMGDAYMHQDKLDDALEMYRLARRSLTKR